MGAAMNRRGILSAMAAAPVMALPAAARALPIVGGDSAAWDRALAAWRAATVASDTYDRDVHDPAHDALDQVAPMTSLYFEHRLDGGKVVQLLAKPDEPDFWEGSEFAGAARATLGAYQQRIKAVDRSGIKAISAESDRLADVTARLECALMLMPAPDRTALMWKLERLFGEDQRGSDGDGAAYRKDWTDAWMADARRLLGDA